MRIRQVKPSFWADAKVASLPERTRLFYIGLWMLADDAGWLRWDPIEAARELYGYESRKFRERRIETMFSELVSIGRVMPFPCGHAYIPKLTEHQHLAALTKQIRVTEKEHRSCLPAGTREDPRKPADIRPVRKGLGNGSVREGQERSRAKDEQEGDGKLKALVYERGLDPSRLVG